MTRILFVCHGNICRSPMAEFLMVKLLRERGMGERVSVASCATSTEEIIGGIGNPVYPPAKRELARHGISCDGKRAVQLKKSDYARYDYIVCMDDNNVRNALRILGGDPDGKVTKLMDHTARGGNVADPWYSGDFETAFRDIEEGCLALLKKL